MVDIVDAGLNLFSVNRWTSDVLPTAEWRNANKRWLVYEPYRRRDSNERCAMRDVRTRVAHYDDFCVQPLADGVIVARGEQRTSARRLEGKGRVTVIVHEERYVGRDEGE